MSKKCLEIVENCFQGNLFTTNTDTKNTENSKKQFKDHKKLTLVCFSHLGPVYIDLFKSRRYCWVFNI